MIAECIYLKIERTKTLVTKYIWVEIKRDIKNMGKSMEI
jgi:hypothetical protein